MLLKLNDNDKPSIAKIALCFNKYLVNITIQTEIFQLKSY